MKQSKSFFDIILSILLLCILASNLFAQSEFIIHSPVTDRTNTLSISEIQSLTNQVNQLEVKKGSQVAVLIISSLGGLSIEEYAFKVADLNKIGRKGIDDGVLFLIAKEDRKMRIEVGYGLEGVIPDVIAKKIVSDYVTPLFREGNYYKGIEIGVNSIIARINQEELPEVKVDQKSDLMTSVIILIFIGFFVRSLLSQFFGLKNDNTSKNKLDLTASLLLVIIGLLIFTIISGFVSAFILYFMLNSNQDDYWFSGGGDSGSFGRWSSSSSESSWSGSGGSFGGGGASGSW